MPVYTDLDIRMKGYEKVTDQKLIRRMPVIIRLDGRSFHSFTRGFKKPFDDILINSMQQTAMYLCKNVQNCVLAYTQSDEISLLLIDYKDFDTQPWFGNRVQKIVSTSAALASITFKEIFKNNIEKFGYKNIPDWDMGGTNECLTDKQQEDLKYIQKLYSAIENKYRGFDSRCFNLSKDEVTNYFFWRQQDCIRNSIQMVGQANFTQNELQNKNTAAIKEMLHEQKNIDFDNDFSTVKQRGSCCIKTYENHEGWEPIKDNNERIGEIRCETQRSYWIIDKNIPIFKDESRDYINELVFV